MGNNEPKIEIIKGLESKALITANYSAGHTDVPWHTHGESEILYINEGFGTGIIGDKLIRYGPGDLIVVGGHLPHSFCSDSESIGKDNSHFLVQFNPKLLNDELLSLNEWSTIADLKNMLNHGVLIKGETAADIAQMLKKMDNASPFRSSLMLYESLEKIATSEKKMISAVAYSSSYHENSRIGKIMNYLFLNFDKDVSIESLAEMVNLSKPAFCNYFKRMVHKRFSEFLNELRINRACTLLRQTDLTVSEICYRCGFSNLAYFNRTFLKLKNTSPLKYRKMVTKKEHVQRV